MDPTQLRSFSDIKHAWGAVGCSKAILSVFVLRNKKDGGMKRYMHYMDATSIGKNFSAQICGIL
jgi:hypothetical protein